MANIPFKSKIILDTGISMGDEGKGRLIPEVIHELITQTGRKDPVKMVMKVNGGANSGHTSGGLKLNLFPAGVIEEGVETLAIGSGVVADPHKFLWEAAYIEHHNYKVLSRLLIDERTMVSDLSHRLLDLAFEDYRVEILGQEKRGSTGRGISPAYGDETSHFAIYYSQFTADKDAFAQKLKARMNRALKTIQYVCEVSEDRWNEFFQILTQAETRANRFLIENNLFDESSFDFNRFKGDRPFTLNQDALVDFYWEAGQKLKSTIGDIRENALAVLKNGDYIIGEFGQAFWLDKRFGFPPNVTASHTTPAEFFLSAGLPIQTAHTFGVCKAYDTKVGTHVFISKFENGHPLGDKLSQLEFGTTTGRQRMVGWYDAVEKGDAIRYAGSDDLVINKLDALSYSDNWTDGDLLICVAYETSDGKRINHVPREVNTHRELKPLYIKLPGWKEDISTVRTFDNLPLNAKRYVAALMKTTMEVAYGSEIKSWPKTLPNLRYIGVGPDPEQIVRDIPETKELIVYP